MPTRSASFVCLVLPFVALSAACSSDAPAQGPGITAGAANGGGGQAGAGATSAGSAGLVSSAGNTAAGAGGTSAAGASGASGAAGAAGTPGGAGAAGAGNPNAMPSAGCGIAATQALATYVKFSETVPGVEAKWQGRDYFVYLPQTYNPTRAYPVVFVGPGCGGSGDKAIPIHSASKEDAIVVGLQQKAAATGRDCFNTESWPDPEEDYVRETLKQVEAKYCIDKSRRFVEGFSSGSWLTNLIGCADGDLFRGQGNASGCTPPLPAMCKGPIAYMAAHDMGDNDNKYSCGESNKNRMVKLNGCTDQTMPYDPGPGVMAKAGVTINCVQYVGCKAPTVWCTTTGLGHNDQIGTGLSTFGFWKFWTSLP